MGDPRQPPSPQAPSISPVTPALGFTQLTAPIPKQPSEPPTSPKSRPPQSHPQSTHPDPTKQPLLTAPPPSVPISLDDNIDAIALRAAIYTLHIQKQKSLRDIQALQKLKKAAIAEPERFLDEYTAGQLKYERRPAEPLEASFEDVIGVGVEGEAQEDEDDEDDEDDDGDDDDEEELAQPSATANPHPAFPKLPSRQNVVRAPPINWAKYHIVGPTLDKMHEAQLKRPTAGEPMRDEDASAQTQPHQVFAPYDPLKDHLEGDKRAPSWTPAAAATTAAVAHPMVTRRASHKPAS